MFKYRSYFFANFLISNTKLIPKVSARLQATKPDSN